MESDWEQAKVLLRNGDFPGLHGFYQWKAAHVWFRHLTDQKSEWVHNPSLLEELRVCRVESAGETDKKGHCHGFQRLRIVQG